jgi:hypothetical protein
MKSTRKRRGVVWCLNNIRLTEGGDANSEQMVEPVRAFHEVALAGETHIPFCMEYR